MVRKVSMAMVGLLAMAVVGCGRQAHDALVDVDTDLGAHALAASADHTAQAVTGRVHLSLATATTAPDRSRTITGDGAYDTSTGLSTMVLDLGSGLTGATEVVQHGDVLYLRMPKLATMQPSLSGTWLRIDRAEAAALRGGPSSDLLGGTIGVGDPSAVLDYLKGAGADVTTVGHEPVGGVDTTHVHATISVQQALEASGADRDKVERSLRQMPGMAETFTGLTLPVDVYVDADGYVRRVTVTVASTGPTAMTMTMTLDYSDFGQPVTITEPAASDTTDVCDLFAMLPTRLKPGASLPAGVC